LLKKLFKHPVGFISRCDPLPIFFFDTKVRKMKKKKINQNQKENLHLEELKVFEYLKISPQLELKSQQQVGGMNFENKTN